ncbi:MAG TPA: hypothetical protein VF638_00865 [Sphingomonas sp.]|jgi:hypothetical protein
MSANAKAGLLLSGIALVLGIGGFNRDCRDAVFGHHVPAMRSAPALSSAAPIEPASPSRPLGASIAIAKGDAQ